MQLSNAVKQIHAVKQSFFKWGISDVMGATEDDTFYEQYDNEATSKSSNENSYSEISKNIGEEI